MIQRNKYKRLVPALMALAASAKFIVEFNRSTGFTLAVWAIGSGYATYIVGAYLSKKEIPAKSGDFSYEDGKNEIARAAYSLVVVFIFMVSLVKEWN